MDQFSHWIDKIDGFVWGPYFLIPLLVGCGIFMTIRLKLIQLTGFGHAWALITGRYDSKEDPGEITHFQALSTALSATIGTGNIAGVATAIAAGGPGAVFWMWVTAVFGMSLKYSSCLLSVRYRKINDDGTVSGGPMYFLSLGLGNKWLGGLFALFAAVASFGIGNMVQANSVAAPLRDHLHIPAWATGFVLALLTAVVILGGLKRIAEVTKRIVPLMSIFYIAAALVILVRFQEAIPAAFQLIFQQAFQPTAAVGGFAGSTVAMALRFGIARGVFSNESGLGSAPMAHAGAQTKEPVREGLVAMLGPFIDTLIICTMTALVILVTGAWKLADAQGQGFTGAVLSSRAFEIGLPGGLGEYVVVFGLVFFAYSTMVAWSYYGDRSVEYLFGPKAVTPYRLLYCLLIPAGAMLELKFVWNISDIANALMALPNLIGIFLLSGTVAALTREYFSRMRN